MTHPLTREIALDLADHLPASTLTTMHNIDGIASLAAVLSLFGTQIQNNGCNCAEAHTFAQIHNRLRDRLSDLECDPTITQAGVILKQADTLCSATLALMTVAGNA
jgi:hypothetical protein